MQQWLNQVKNVWNEITSNRYSKLVLTVSVSAIGISIAACYYFDLSRSRKRILHKRKLFEILPELGKANVKIKNPKYVEQILSNLIQSGKQRLQVISDFDRTISLHSYDGNPCLTSNCNFCF